MFADAGCMYCVIADKFLKYKNLITPKTKAHIIPLSKAIDVDTEDDFKILNGFIMMYNKILDILIASFF